MITGTFSLIAIKDGEDATVRHIDCSVAAVAVDANNVQRQAAVFSLVETAGTASKPFPARLRLTVLAGEVPLHQQATGSVTEYSYTLPATRYGTATALRCEAFADEGLTEEACPPLTVAIVRENPVPFPRGEEWAADNVYKNGEYLMSGGVVYMWRNPVAGNSAVDPKTDIEQSPEATSWTAYQEWPLLATQVMLARWAKLGSAIFSGDYMFSQHGRDASGADTDQYTLFDPAKLGQAGCPFTPNVAVDWLLGKLIGLDMDIRGGRIANFRITGGNLSNDGGEDCWISIDVTDSDGSRRVSSLGNNLPASVGSVAGGFEATGPNENHALRLHASGSSLGRNFALDAYGGCNWTIPAGDFFKMPGFLWGCVVYTTSNTYSLEQTWGNGLSLVGDGLTLNSEREYHLYHDLGHKDYFFFALPTGQRESGAWDSCSPGYILREPGELSLVFWDGSNKVYPMRFQLMVVGRPKA